MIEDPARLIPLNEPGTEYPVDESPFRIGRNSSAGLFIPDSDVSREHAVIEEKDGRYTIRDAGSTNGTLLNGKPVGEDPAELCDNDLITISRSHEYIFVLPGKTMLIPDPLHEYGLVIDPAAYQVSVDGIPLSPDKRGFQLLCLLAEVPGKVYTYAEIAERLYPEDQDPESRVQRVQAAKNDLSKHLKSLGITRRPVKSKSGIGYYLDKDQAGPNRRFS